MGGGVMLDDDLSGALVTLVVAVALDVALLSRRRPVNVALAFIQIAFSATMIGASLLAETAKDGSAILVLGAATKGLIHAAFSGVVPALEDSARGAGSTDTSRLFTLASAMVVPVYAFLAVRGGLIWFQAADLRLAYMAENSAVLRVVRHWTPVLFVWGITVLKLQRSGSRTPLLTREDAITAGLLCAHFAAYSLLEGSKSAGLVLVVIGAGAAQLVGHRARTGTVVAMAASAVLLLGYFLSLVAAEGSSSLLDTFLARMVSGSQGFLFAVAPPGGKYCSIGTFWFPLTNFLSKALLQTPPFGFTSMGHCLGATDPSYPWELLVPLLPAAYHVASWTVPLFAGAYLVFARLTVKGVSRACSAVGLQGIAFPMSYFVAFHVLMLATSGKLANLLVSELVSIAGLIVVLSALNVVSQRAGVARALTR